eukprot:gb/GECG01007127.1/.p1 GENE.gb/GECG01007127.1/~~gb/GECG01007127.1/.p1  ORF type:complete len:813 (+),score=57.74 gb/GECG01007127.1/:1-2439(+)
MHACILDGNLEYRTDGMILRIAWPIDATNVEEPGWLIGWTTTYNEGTSSPEYDETSGRNSSSYAVPKKRRDYDGNSGDTHGNGGRTQGDPNHGIGNEVQTDGHVSGNGDKDCVEGSQATGIADSATTTVVGIIPKRVISNPRVATCFLDSVNKSSAFETVKSYCNGTLVLLGEWFVRQLSQPSHEDTDHQKGHIWIVLEAGHLPGIQVEKTAACGNFLTHQATLLSESGRFAPTLRKGFYRRQEINSFHILFYQRRRLDRFEYYSNSLYTYQRYHGATEFELLLHQINVAPIVLGLIKTWLQNSFANVVSDTIPVETANNLPAQNQVLIKKVMVEVYNVCPKAVNNNYPKRSLEAHTSTEKESYQIVNSTSESGIVRALKWAACQPIIAVMLFLRMYAEVIISFLNIQVPIWSPLFGGKRFRQISVLGKLMDRKCREYCTWPSVLVHLRRATGHKDAERWYWESPHAAASHHIAVYSSMSLALLDVVLGLCLGLYLMANSFESGPVLRGLHHLVRITHIEVLKNNIEWLMGVPAGFKFNQALSYRLGCINLEAIDAWDTITTLLTPWEPVIVLGIGMCGVFGITLIFALTTDILNFATFHISVLRSIFARVHAFNLSVLASLWRLFRGKKWNVLRERVDSAEFDTSELLMGTLLFACVFFLFTTWFVYYAFFSFLWLFVLSMRAALWTLMAILNRFPFYAVYMKFWYPYSMPGKTAIQLIGRVQGKDDCSNEGYENMCMQVISFPAPIGAIFNVYADVWGNLKAHYSPTKIILAALKGEEVSQAPEFTGDFNPSMPTPTVSEYTNAVIQLFR